MPIVVATDTVGDSAIRKLARMREEYDRTGSTNEAVVRSLAHPGRLVTCAALILASSFASLSSTPDVVVVAVIATCRASAA